MELLALVIDADANQRRFARDILQRDGWRVYEAEAVEAALDLAGRVSGWGLVFCDAELSTRHVELPDNLTLLGELKRRYGGSAQVVITAAAGRPTGALEAILNGAYEYLRKPLQEEALIECSRAVIERLRAVEREEGREPRGLREVAAELTAAAPEFVGESPAIIKVFRDLAKVVSDLRETDLQRRGSASAATPQTSVFITGETGTGKELIAQLIHQRSRQTVGRFVPVNCSNLSQDLAESQLFGHTPGAFTGALKEKEGLWELADGGTLFLDEVTEAPPSVLPKILRVLQDGQVKRLGSNRAKQTSVQVVAASNRDMQTEIGAGRFRHDLYYRLSLHKLHIPPLRERLEDVPLIVEHLSRRHFTRQIRFSQEALELLMTYSYPGNVRELENIVRGAARMSPDGVVYAVDLSAYIELAREGNSHDMNRLAAPQSAGAANAYVPANGEGLEEWVHRYRLQVVKETLAKCNGNVTQTARALKISRPSLYKMLREIEQRSASGYEQISSTSTRSISASA